MVITGVKNGSPDKILTAFAGKFNEKKDEITPGACRPPNKLKKEQWVKVDHHSVEKNNVEKVGPPKVEKKQWVKVGPKKLKKTMSIKWVYICLHTFIYLHIPSYTPEYLYIPLYPPYKLKYPILGK